METSSTMRGIDDKRRLVGDVGIASGLSLGRSVRFDGIAAEMSSRPGPGGWRSDYPVGEVICSLFVVDPPSVKIWPRVFGRAFHRESALFQHVDGILKLLKLKLDRLVWLWIEIDLPTKR